MITFKKDSNKISYAFLFSLLIHLGIGLSYVKHKLNPEFNATAFKTAPHTIGTIKLDDIKVISPKALKAIKESQGKQIVANENNGRKEKPKNSRFQGEMDQTFDRQTMARTNGSFKEAGLGRKTGSVGAIAQSETPKASPAPAKKAKSISKGAQTLSLSALGNFEIAQVAEEQAKAIEEEKAMAKAMEGNGKESQALGIEKGKSGVNGLAQSNDFVEEVPLGDMTNLNTTENKYYGFYHRIRQKLEQHWGSSIKDKVKNLYRSKSRVPASENLITSVTVILNEAGNIVDIKIEGTSGVRELDQAAIESFNKAGPFPNPPKGLLVGGRATIQWGFVVKS